MLKYKKRSRLLGDKEIPTLALIALEIFAIVVGVMLGFIVNEWRENRANLKIADHAMQSIAAEFRFNHQQMEEKYAYYSNIIGQIDSLRAAEEPVREMYGYQLNGFQGAVPPMLRSSAYNMVMTTGIIKDIPFEIANKLAFIYTVQNLIEKIDDANLVNFTQDSGFTALQNLRHMFSLYTDLIPAVIGTYQLLGIPILEIHGYDLRLPDGDLKSTSEEQMKYLDVDRFL